MATDGALLVPIKPGPEGAGARLGGLGRTTLYELVNGGKLKKVNIGRRSFITAESIQSYVNSLMAEGDGGDAA